VSALVQFWVFLVAMLSAYFVLVWKSTADPRLIVFTFIVLVFFAMGTRLFRCPHCRNPIMKHPTTRNQFGYEWRLPTSGTCPNCGARFFRW
jgi:DNA-directed RNA polymerase subunit RPC12/RpoP